MDVVLNIACPAALEEELIELLRSRPEQVSGFTTIPAEGFGSGTRLHSAIEQVRGRSRRRLLQVLLASSEVGPLVEFLRAELPSDEVAWWTQPVSGFGRFG
jgi:hypothetical protein